MHDVVVVGISGRGALAPSSRECRMGGVCSLLLWRHVGHNLRQWLTASPVWRSGRRMRFAMRKLKGRGRSIIGRRHCVHRNVNRQTSVKLGLISEAQCLATHTSGQCDVELVGPIYGVIVVVCPSGG